MTEDSSVRVSSSDEATTANDASQARQRKKRKWDQPAESLLPVGMPVYGALPLSNATTPLGGVAFPGVAPAVSGALLTNPLAASVQLQQQQTAVTAAQKLTQQKIQDELVIAREIIINDAESSIRYKLTKRQTQEEIQRCTGTIVITRGKYRPPTAPPDGEKPLYLHISAGAHIKETAERILVVDRAAAMIEEMLRQGQNSPSISTASPPSALANGVTMLSACVFLGFDADPSLNIVARIRGPNDQYINHIMNETGVTVTLRGRGSGNDECMSGEDGQQPMHLFLSSNNLKSLEDARCLAENLLDTISVECGASRVPSCKVYSAVPPPQQAYTAVPPPQQVYTAFPPPQQVYNGPSLSKQISTAISPPQQVYRAVPPPQQLLAGVQSSGVELEGIAGLTTSSLSSTVAPTPVPPASLIGVPGVTTTLMSATITQSTGYLSSGPQANMIGYTLPSVSGGTSYIGYGGIYPQATPMQQVALALRHSPPVASTVAPTTSTSNGESKSTTSSNPEKERRPPQRRKFQELPVGSKSTTKLNQGLEPLRPNEQSDDLVVRNTSNMPAPRKLMQSNGMAPPPPRTMPPPPPTLRTMPPPPPPPKFSDAPEVKVQDKSKNLLKTKSDAVPDTLIKLMEYGEDDDDVDDSSEEPLPRTTQANGVQKPFWAL